MTHHTIARDTDGREGAGLDGGFGCGSSGLCLDGGDGHEGDGSEGLHLDSENPKIPTSGCV